MAVFKCKMCGGTLEISNETVAVCEYCGTQQTLPKLDDDRRANLYDRANHFRRNNEFDKAMGIYEQILNEDNTDAEAYWSLVLCRYGIEYVEDPATHKRVPTVNRAQFTSIFDDDNYRSALQFADAAQRSVFEEEARAINEIQKGILAISQKEEPFDVFICYKESDNNGRRTPDSVLANDLYHQLTQEGFKVFFARITLEDKLGAAYEPYIFAALNSAKVMVVLGTKPEYFKAVWVRNEWSRYLSLIKQGQKKMLIPAYKDMDPYDLPDEFSHLQAQDMSKLGFMQDLIRGIKKIARAEEPKTTVVKETVVAGGNANTAPLLRRVFMFLEDGEWQSADEYCEKVLDIDPENALAYLGKLMAELRISTKEALRDRDERFDDRSNYQKALRFGDAKLNEELAGITEYIITRNENARLEGIYLHASKAMSTAKTEYQFKEAAKLFESIPGYKDASALAGECLERAESARKDEYLLEGKIKMAGGDIKDYQKAVRLFAMIPGWKDADQQAAACRDKIAELEAQQKAREEARRQEEVRIAQEEQERLKRNMKITKIVLAAAGVVVAALILTFTLIIPTVRYNNAVALMEAERYEEAALVFYELDGFRDSLEKKDEADKLYTLAEHYNDALALLDEGNYENAISKLEKPAEEGFKDSASKLEECKMVFYNKGVALMSEEKYVEAIAEFKVVEDFKDSASKIKECKNTAYNKAMSLMNEEKYDEAIAMFEQIKGYNDSVSQIVTCESLIKYNNAISLLDGGDIFAAYGLLMEVGNLKDAEEIIARRRMDLAKREIISAGGNHTVGLKADGTVVAVGEHYYGRCNVFGWTDIVAISAGEYHTVGLKADGTVVAVGSNNYGKCDVSDWTDIVAISAGFTHTVGLKVDGTVVAVGSNNYGKCDVSSWQDIVAICAGDYHTVGLKADGTVVAVGENDYGECDVSDWTDIIAISAGYDCTVGLKADGTVVAVGENDYGECNVSGWKDIVAISAGCYHTVGLKADGTVVAVGENDVSGWKDIVAICAGDYHTVGLKADGTVVAVGDNDNGQCNVSGWSNIKLPEKNTTGK